MRSSPSTNERYIFLLLDKEEETQLVLDRALREQRVVRPRTPGLLAQTEDVLLLAPRPVLKDHHIPHVRRRPREEAHLALHVLFHVPLVDRAVGVDAHEHREPAGTARAPSSLFGVRREDEYHVQQKVE